MRHSFVAVGFDDLIEIEELVRDMIAVIIEKDQIQQKGILGPGFFEGVDTDLFFHEEEGEEREGQRRRSSNRVSVGRNGKSITLRHRWALPQGISFSDFSVLLQIKLEQALLPTGKFGSIIGLGGSTTLRVQPKK